MCRAFSTQRSMNTPSLRKEREASSRALTKVFVLWGAAAGRKASMIDPSRHRILRSPHPSPLSAHRGFFGCRHFSEINAHLAQLGEDPIDWGLPD